MFRGNCCAHDEGTDGGGPIHEEIQVRVLRSVMDWRSLQVDRGALVFMWFGMDVDRCRQARRGSLVLHGQPVCCLPFYSCLPYVFLSRSRHFLQASQTVIVFGAVRISGPLKPARRTQSGNLILAGHPQRFLCLTSGEAARGKLRFRYLGGSCVIS